MNEHIELVKKWLDDPDSVTQRELEANAAAANAAANADFDAAEDADAVYDADPYAAYATASQAAYAAANAADAADEAEDEAAARWVKKYEEINDE